MNIKLLVLIEVGPINRTVSADSSRIAFHIESPLVPIADARRYLARGDLRPNSDINTHAACPCCEDVAAFSLVV